MKPAHAGHASRAEAVANEERLVGWEGEYCSKRRRSGGLQKGVAKEGRRVQEKVGQNWFGAAAKLAVGRSLPTRRLTQQGCAWGGPQRPHRSLLLRKL